MALQIRILLTESGYAALEKDGIDYKQATKAIAGVLGSQTGSSAIRLPTVEEVNPMIDELLAKDDKPK